MTLSLYVARRFASTVALVLLVFFGLLILIDTIEQLRRFSGAGIGLADAVHLAFLNVPATLYRILPLVLVIGATAFFLALARSSELVAVRAAGRSGLRFLATPVTVALLAGLFAVAVLNPLVAATSKAHEDLRSRYAQAGSAVASVSGSGLWLRQGGDYGQTVIHAARSNPDGTELQDVSFLTFRHDGTPAERLDARSARLVPGAWVVEGARLWHLSEANPEAAATNLPAGTHLPTELTAERIREGLGPPDTVSIWKIPAQIAELERAGFSARSYRLWLQIELAQPLLLAAMVLVAAGFTMRPARFSRTAIMVLYAILSGFALFFLRNIAQALGESGQIPLALAAWSPPVAAVLLSLGLLLHLEEG